MKTYKNIDIKYYDNDGNIHVRCSVPVTQDALVHYELMQSHYCKLSFKLYKPTYFLLGDFIDTPYGRFELIDLTKAKDNDTIGYSYEIQFDAYYRKFKNKILKYRPNTGSQEATFSLTSKISTHVEVIMKSLAYYAKLDKSYLYDPKFEGEGTDYTYVIDASVDANAAKLITYSNTSVLDAIANIAQTFECEWWFEGNILHFGTCENTNAIVDFRLNDNIVSMSSSQSQSTYANRVYAFGAARNLPSGYKNDADADITKDGVVEKRLMLPTSAECSDKNKQLLAENGFELKNGYIQVGGLHEDQYVEGVTTNDDIYPRNLIKTSNVTSYEKDVEDESTPEEGDYIKRTFYRVNSLTIVNDDGEKTGDMAFRKAYILSGKNLHIVFQSGSLNGMDFECEFNPDGVSEILKDDDGNPILKDGKEQINPKSQVFEIVANEDYGRFLPDTTLHPKDGDTFVLYNWDSTKLGDALVSAASNELLTDSIKNLKKSIIDPTTYTCTAEANYSFNQGRGNLHGVGDRVNLYNKGYDDSYRSSRVIGYEFSLDIPFDGAKYYVGEKPSYSRLNAMESKIEELVYNGQSYLNGNGGSGRSIYIIKSYDSITPTDYNVFSAKAVDEQRLNKTKDDTVKGTITWEKVQKFFSGLHVGNSNNENGGSWTPDAEGRSHLITDYLEVRMKAIFEELVINKTSTIGGKEIISPAGGVVAHKVEEVTVTYNNVSQKAYRCYFLAEQEGDAVDNDFAVGDQVRSESFNVRKGTYHKAGNHFYWRLVIGRDEDPVELEGKKYHYIDLSDTDCATASDVPAKGDVLNQCGNRTDVERQNCLIFSAVDTYSPSISLYHGINSYSFANREYVEYGVNKQNNKAFFNVYGDMYVGDRPTKENGYEGSSYIRYDSSTKQLSVKGKISAKSTVDGKELSQYFKKIGELQNQVDGAIETWFYDGVPTLENAPAISWKTDKDKEIHLGDLYYNNKTGKAYRFAKDSNTYKWTIITDTDIAKALSDARMAQETANGKMKVFSVQPTTPYQVGDIWVNATYPSDGSTYKNEVLRCQTNKAAGSQFAIGDWIKASKYTDDTVANAAKKAAEDAQKAAQTAQTDIKNLGNTVTDNKKEFDNYVTDGYLEPSEIAAMAQDSKRLEDDFAAAQKSYNEVKDAEVLKDTKELTDLTSAFTDLSDAKKELIKYLSDISKRYNETDTNGKAAIVSAVGTKFTNFQNAYSAFYDKLGLANAYITRKIYGDLKQNITDLAGYKYLKDALGQTTDIDGGLVMTTLLALRDGDGNVQSGINGAIDPNRGKKSIATWWGGQMVDKDYNSGNLTPATSLIRFDGSGYLANGAIWWDVSGKVHADPTSFIISEKNLGAYLIFFEPTWKEGSAGTSVADLVSLKPNAPFSKLGVSGDATFEGAISFHGIKLTYDSTNKAIKIDGNLYATGGITAYGAGASTTGGGGGLNGSVKSYSSALKLTSESLSEIASAYSIKALDSRISSLEGGSATAISVSGSGNAVTSVTKNGTTISVVKGSTFLTSHQSLDGYVNAISVSGSGNAITSVSKSGKGITFTKGATFLTSHQSLANYYTKSSVDSLLSGKSATSHTHSVKINGVTKTIAATGGTAVDLGTYLTSHQSLANYVTINDSRLSDSRYPKFANNTWYLVGDDAYIGDHNIGGTFCIKSANNVNVSGIAIYNSDETKVAKLWFDNTNINLDKQLVMNNKRIWIQGVGTAGGNNNRLTLVAGMPSGLAYNTSCRGTILYSNGIAFADPYNGNSNNDSGWIRHLETSANSGTLEIAVGDDASNEQIHFRWYNTNSSAETIAHDITVPRATGTLALTSQIPTTLPANGGNADKLDGYHANGLLTALSNSDKGISITVGGTTKSISNISVNYASSADTATTSSMLKTSNWDGGMYVPSDTHYMCLGYMNCTGSFDCLTLLVTSAFWGNQHGSQDIITIQQSTNTNDTSRIQTNVGRLRLGGSHERSFYYYKDGSRFRLYLYVYVIGGNAYGKWNISYLGGNATWVTDHQENVTKSSSWIGIGYSAQVNYASSSGSASKVYGHVGDTGSHELVRCDMNNDQFRIIAGSSGNKGWAEIAIADGGNEPIYVRQYSGVFSSVVRTLTLLDANGHTHFPSYINIGGNENNNSSPDRVWGSNGSDSYLRSYRTSALNVNYAASAGNADTVDGYQVNGSNVAPYGHIPSIENDGVMEVGKYIDFHNDNSGKYDFSTRLQTTGNYGNSVYLPSHNGTLALISDNVASATKLATARSIWGQSFDGTGNVNGTIYINNSNSRNGAIRLNSDISSNARISAIDDQVIFNTGNAIRFGETAWDWSKWAGLKYTHSNKTIYLGIADNSVFNANSAQSNGTLRLAGITTITPDSGARIGGSDGNLYLGNANNSGWVCTQDICSQTSSSIWSIRQDGNAYFNSININSGATFNGPVKVNNMLTARGIMFTTADSNVYGTSLQNWDGSIGAHVTNMFNGIDSNNISLEYSTNGGSSWLTYTDNPNYLFNLINDNSDTESFFLGNNVISGSSDADKLAQIKRNQLRVTIKIPPEVYQELAWISVDVNKGVDIKCQVYFGNSNGVYTEYVSKVLKGWPHRCDICVGPANVNVGNDTYRYVRLVFSHLSSHTALRNGIISRIRALALTKYNNGSERYNISTTGHIYNYDYNMNTYFPNSILAKGGVTAYQSSDIRLKQDLRKLDYLGIIKAMGGTFGFAWKKDNTRSIGWIAQHVLCNPHLKDIVETDEKGYYKINYWSPKLIATAFGAIEQVGDEVSRLKARVVFLESEVQRLSGDKEDCNKKRLDNKNINSLN